MDYFVTAENHPYYQWQIELLIESFKQTKCEKDLLVVLAENKKFNKPLFFKNISNNKRIIGFKNIGEKRGFVPLNQLFYMAWAFQFGKIKQPFAVIQPDMIFRKPISIEFKDYPECVFYPDPFFTIDTVIKNVGPFWEWANKSKSEYATRWIPLGSIFVLNNIQNNFFELVISRAELLCTYQLMTQGKIWEKTIQLAISLTLSDLVDNVFSRGDYSLVSPILGGTDTAFISYENGLLPDFHKSMFAYATKNLVSFGNPLQILSQNFSTPNAHYVSVIAEKYLKN